jgi:hypothetical protein
MPATYRLVDSKGELLASGDSIGYLKGLVADLDSGHYTVEEIWGAPGASGHTRRRWGIIFKLEDGTIISEPDPWEA